MRKTPLRTAGFALASMFMILFSTLALSGTAFASTKTTALTTLHDGTVQKANTLSPCHSLLVHLNGNLPATTTCLDKKTTGQVSPAISQTDCSIKKALWIHWDANWQGACIGFIGQGRANLTDYVSCHNALQCYNWNDQASSFQTGCSGVDFFTDINAQGDWAYADPYEAYNFPYQGVGNDQLSSIVILNNC